jgi:glyoxylase-like metal-dependent hydrolase (beta-lactamase superfamily II)
MKIHFLASSSRANCTLIEARGELLVVDAGLPVKAFLGHLRTLFPNVKDHCLSALKGIVISHHHADHAGRSGELSGALHVPLFASSETVEAAAQKVISKAENVQVFTPGERFVVGAFRILPVETYHVPGAVGFRIETFEGSTAIFTDLPEITEPIGKALEGCGVVAIEADYIEAMLATSDYVDDLKQRIRMTHMATETLARFLRNGFDATGLHDLVLLHLSTQCNIAFLSEAKIRAAVPPSVKVCAVSEGNLPLTVNL